MLLSVWPAWLSLIALHAIVMLSVVSASGCTPSRLVLSAWNIPLSLSLCHAQTHIQRDTPISILGTLHLVIAVVSVSTSLSFLLSVWNEELLCVA